MNRFASFGRWWITDEMKWQPHKTKTSTSTFNSILLFNWFCRFIHFYVFLLWFYKCGHKIENRKWQGRQRKIANVKQSWNKKPIINLERTIRVSAFKNRKEKCHSHHLTFEKREVGMQFDTVNNRKSIFLYFVTQLHFPNEHFFLSIFNSVYNLLQTKLDEKWSKNPFTNRVQSTNQK